MNTDQKNNADMYKSFGLKNTPENFIAGKTQLFKTNWAKITKDKWINSVIMGYKVELEEIPIQKSIPKPIQFTKEEQDKIDIEIRRFLEHNIVEEVTNSDPDEFISNIFCRPKKDGKVRIILNLKIFNEFFLEKIHFKMETLQSAIDAMRKDCFFGSVDLAEAFYSLPIRKSDRKFFRFFHQGRKYQFTALIMGLTHSPRVFTKILKPVFAALRAKGHVSSAYIDDSCLQGSSYRNCVENIVDTVCLMDSLGLTVHPLKSVFVPTQQIVFLGFVLCSVTMTIRLTPERCIEVIKSCQEILVAKRVTIRLFSKLIGKLVASQQGVEYAPLFYKPLEKYKDKILKQHRGNYNSFMTVPQSITPTIQWWIKNISTSFKVVSHGPPKLVLFTDASQKGWGAFNETDNIRTGGVWSVTEQSAHINIMELKACQLGLKSFCKDITNTHIRIFMDNVSSCAYINKFGGKSPELDSLAREIWFWCLDRHIHLSAAHVPGLENSEADEESRAGSENEDTEWSLDAEVFHSIHDLYPHLSIDLFASRLNYKLDKFVSRRPDPNAYAIDAFSLTWTNEGFFIFAPFSLLPRILQKVEEDKTSAVLIAPIWPTQSWWPSLLHLICGQCYQLPNTQDILRLPHKPSIRHPLKKMTLGCFHISGHPSNRKGFQHRLVTSFSSPGESPPKNNITRTSRSGFLSVDNRLTPFDPVSIMF